MSEIMVLKITFGILLFLGGTVLIILAYFLGYPYLIQEKRCTSKTKGIVKGYSAVTRGGVCLPKVQYTVNGQIYKVVGPRYKSYISTNISTPFSKNTYEMTDKNQVLKVKRSSNSLVGISKNPMAELYPIDSEIDVFYDPNNPKLSFVLRYCNNKKEFWLMLISGIALYILDILMLILL